MKKKLNNAQNIESNIQVYRQALLASLSKLNEQHTLKTGLEEIRDILINYCGDSERVQVTVSCINESNNGTSGSNAKMGTKKENIRVIGVLASVLEDRLLDQLPKVISILNKRLKEGESYLSSVIADTFGQVIEYTLRRVDDQTGVRCLSSIIRSVHQNFSNNSIHVQQTAAMALQRIIQSATPSCMIVMKEEFVCLLLELMKNYPKVNANLLESLLALIMGIEQHFRPYVEITLPILIEFITHTTWNVRKIAIDVIYTLTVFMCDALTPKIDLLIQSLNTAKTDKIKHVRDSAILALNMIKDKLQLNSINFNNNNNVNNNNLYNIPSPNSSQPQNIPVKKPVLMHEKHNSLSNNKNAYNLEIKHSPISDSSENLLIPNENSNLDKYNKERKEIEQKKKQSAQKNELKSKREVSQEQGITPNPQQTKSHQSLKKHNINPEFLRNAVKGEVEIKEGKKEIIKTPSKMGNVMNLAQVSPIHPTNANNYVGSSEQQQSLRFKIQDLLHDNEEQEEVDQADGEYEEEEEDIQSKEDHHLNVFIPQEDFIQQQSRQFQNEKNIEIKDNRIQSNEDPHLNQFIRQGDFIQQQSRQVQNEKNIEIKDNRLPQSQSIQEQDNYEFISQQQQQKPQIIQYDQYKYIQEQPPIYNVGVQMNQAQNQFHPQRNESVQSPVVLEIIEQNQAKILERLYLIENDLQREVVNLHQRIAFLEDTQERLFQRQNQNTNIMTPQPYFTNFQNRQLNNNNILSPNILANGQQIFPVSAVPIPLSFNQFISANQTAQFGRNQDAFRKSHELTLGITPQTFNSEPIRSNNIPQNLQNYQNQLLNQDQFPQKILQLSKQQDDSLKYEQNVSPRSTSYPLTKKHYLPNNNIPQINSQESNIFNKINKCIAEDKLNKAYGLALTSNDDQIIFELMNSTNVCVNRLDAIHLEYLMIKLCGFLERLEKVSVILPWISQTLDLKLQLSENVLAALRSSLNGMIDKATNQKYGTLSSKDHNASLNLINQLQNYPFKQIAKNGQISQVSLNNQIGLNTKIELNEQGGPSNQQQYYQVESQDAIKINQYGQQYDASQKTSEINTIKREINQNMQNNNENIQNNKNQEYILRSQKPSLVQNNECSNQNKIDLDNMNQGPRRMNNSISNNKLVSHVNEKPSSDTNYIVNSNYNNPLSSNQIVTTDAPKLNDNQSMKLPSNYNSVGNDRYNQNNSQKSGNLVQSQIDASSLDQLLNRAPISLAQNYVMPPISIVDTDQNYLVSLNNQTQLLSGNPLTQLSSTDALAPPQQTPTTNYNQFSVGNYQGYLPAGSNTPYVPNYGIISGQYIHNSAQYIPNSATYPPPSSFLGASNPFSLISSKLPEVNSSSVTNMNNPLQYSFDPNIYS